jgi:hypothetical protein
MPFNFITVFDMSRYLKNDFSSLAISEMDHPVVTASDEKRIFKGTLD